MSSTFDTFTVYMLRVAPGLVLGGLVLFLTRREARLRIVLYLALFVLLRDALTPLRLWSFGTEGCFWIRLHSDPWFLAAFGLSSLGLALAPYYLDGPNRPLVRWLRASAPAGFLWGAAGAVVVTAPCAVIYQYTPVESRGGSVSSELLPAVLLFALLGNLLEEMLFRGYVYGWLAQQMAPLPAGLSSGVVFAFCHIFLAITVTGVGYPLLAFTLWEGVIAGVVGAKAGVLPSTLTHGGAIFLLSSGLL